MNKLKALIIMALITCVALIIMVILDMKASTIVSFGLVGLLNFVSAGFYVKY